MSVDFSKVKSMTIPEGVVTQIADASGVVLWKAAPAEATVTITGRNTANTNDANVQINGKTYVSPATVIVPIGTVIICTASYLYYMSRDSGGTIKLNGVTVAQGTNLNKTVTYEYTVIGNVEIELSAQPVSTNVGFGSVFITEQ